MTDYKRYINALRKCAKEHENDKTFTGHIIVSDLCQDTADLLETLEQKPKSEWQQDHEILRAYSDGANEMLDNIFTDIQKLRGCSCSCSDGVIDDVEDIMDKYKTKSEE